MYKNIFTLLTCITLLTASGCRKYVEIPPENIRVLELTSDYQQLLYNGNVMSTAYALPIFAGDDLGTDNVLWQNGLNEIRAKVYTWAPTIYTETEEDPEWARLYQQLYICNTIITGVMDSKGGTAAEKRAALAAALVHRAFAYYTLVNIYAKQYDPATAPADPGVPLVLEPKFFTDLTRASVQQVYDQIETDLNTALPDLPDVADYVSNPSKSAAYAMLSRVYLNTREFPLAKRNAELALQLKNTLLNLQEYEGGARQLPTRLLDPEMIFQKVVSYYPVNFPLSPRAVNLYESKDLRLTMFTIPGLQAPGASFSTPSYNKHRATNDGSLYAGPTVPEMILIKAECEARENQVDAAMESLNLLRIKRFRTADYLRLSAATANEALHLIVDERAREFPATGIRWFDQRRLSKDAGFISTVTRVFKGVTYNLEPGSNRYTFPIGGKYIQLNPEIIQNPR